MLRIVVLFFALSGIAAAQSTVQFDFGVRGGLLANNSFQANQLCSGSGCAFGTRSFTAEKLHGTVGPAAGVLFYDRVEVRFEAVRRRFGYQIQRDLVVPSLTQHSVDSTRGHLWEYPLLATYRFSSGPVRPFAGGGLSLGTSGSYSTEFQFTSTTTQPPGGPITTSSLERRTYNLRGSTAYYVVGGVDGRTSYLSIRPEIRYSRFPNDSNSNAEAILNANQLEFLIGISAHPFRIKK